MRPFNSMSRFAPCVVIALALLAVSPAANAMAPSSSTTSASRACAADPEPPTRGAAMRRFAPTAGQLELGMYGGLMVPSRNHGLYGTQWRGLRPVVGSIGARIGYFPLPWIGGEVEGGGFPGRTADGSDFNAFALRGHAVFQVPLRLAPFVLAGAGALMVRTPKAVLGSDIDPAAHIGTGLKFRALRWLTLRVEWRGTFANNRNGGEGAPAMYNELLLGVSFVFGGRPRLE